MVLVRIPAYMSVGPHASRILDTEHDTFDALVANTKLFTKHKRAPKSTTAHNSCAIQNSSLGSHS